MIGRRGTVRGRVLVSEDGGVDVSLPWGAGETDDPVVVLRDGRRSTEYPLSVTTGVAGDRWARAVLVVTDRDAPDGAWSVAVRSDGSERRLLLDGEPDATERGRSAGRAVAVRTGRGGRAILQVEEAAPAVVVRRTTVTFGSVGLTCCWDGVAPDALEVTARRTRLTLPVDDLGGSAEVELPLLAMAEAGDAVWAVGAVVGGDRSDVRPMVPKRLATLSTPIRLVQPVVGTLLRVRVFADRAGALRVSIGHVSTGVP